MTKRTSRRPASWGPKTILPDNICNSAKAILSSLVQLQLHLNIPISVTYSLFACDHFTGHVLDA